MKLIAAVILVLIQLNHIHLPALEKNLKRHLTASSAGPQLLRPAPHHNLVQPIKVGLAELHLSARNIYAMDLDSAQPLISQNAAQPRPIASIAKLVTVMVILNTHSLDEIVTVSSLPSYSPGDVILGIKPGQQFKLRYLLAAALIPSANDAADALALYDSPTVPAFAAKMNRLTERWGISDTRFTNPSGLSDPENLASAEALAKLSKIALANTTFTQLVSTSNATISDTAGKSYNLTSSNHLLESDPRIQGLKTGYTASAGQCLVALANIRGHRVITVILGSPDRFGETTQLVNWIEQNYTWL